MIKVEGPARTLGLIFHREDGGSKFLRNVRELAQDCTGGTSMKMFIVSALRTP
jgi:hypothetical protein